MTYDAELGIYTFIGLEQDIAWQYMWTCLTDMSFWGKVETTWRIWMVKPPKRYFEIRQDFINRAKGKY